MFHHKDRLVLAIIWLKEISIAARRMRSKIQSIYSRSCVLQAYLILKAKAATFAQKGSNGATRRGRANEASNYKESMVAEASCFNIDLNRVSHDR